ncbi:MAG: hypothetical protein JXB05_25840 [Myxococcaceae bacterium]|nr:hypothetical protein [Myxococcaceae bacterium]
MIKNIVSGAAVLLGAGALLTGCNFDQPSAGCITQDSPSWAAKYDLKEGQTIPDGCKAEMVGELLGVFKYTNPDAAGQSRLTLRPATLASRAARDPGDPYLQTAVGTLAEEPDAQEFCGATDFSPATVNAAASASEDATSITYQFANVKVFASPKAPGTQLTGDVTITRDGCSLQYTVRALWPAVGCDPDPNNKNPLETCGEGSGISPDFAVVCNEDLGFCVLEKPVPSFKDGVE